MAATAFVIKSWSASSNPDADQNYVNISGRAGGLVAWLLNALGISPTVRLIVSGEKIIFQKGSLEGTLNFLTPLENTCSMFYAFKRPLKEAIVLGIVLGLATFFTFGILGIAIAILYYVLNKTLTIGFTDMGGRMSEIPFKRSVIEGQVIDEAEAARVCDIVQRLVDARRECTLARV
ncbi:MAG TPA: hypothetical protein VMU57_01610 [Edaphobacter sp.]|uniref:hypothetical protein n=1 Tax=Edaphobacter sp. TaxID=1934404 RepID=UPI002B7128AD|nr:hypothetical protein [Edaphobacter sp.]HUZ93589.1 hypothetical protein [Edaphobacter sp.]